MAAEEPERNRASCHRGAGRQEMERSPRRWHRMAKAMAFARQDAG